MGTARDMQQRETMARVDNMQRRNLVDAARRVIYEKNFRVNSAGVKNMLQDTSLVPTAVRVHLAISENNFLNLLKFHRTRSPTGCIPSALTSSPCCFRM